MRIKKVELEWYAFMLDCNRNEVIFYNVLYGMKEQIAKKIKKGAKDTYKPVTDYSSFKEYIMSELKYHYWSKSEYEYMVGSWCAIPTLEKHLEKHDVWWQLEPNIDRICEYIINEMKIEFK